MSATQAGIVLLITFWCFEDAEMVANVDFFMSYQKSYHFKGVNVSWTLVLGLSLCNNVINRKHGIMHN